MSSVSLPLPLRLLVSWAHTGENLLLNSSYARFTVVAVFTKLVAKQGSSHARTRGETSKMAQIASSSSIGRHSLGVKSHQTLEAEIRARLAAPRASNQAMEPTPPGLIMSSFTIQPFTTSGPHRGRRGSCLVSR